MNPQHLMPGNYILYNGKEVIVTPQLLITMQSPCKCKLFSPIVITEYWLDDFGFFFFNGVWFEKKTGNFCLLEKDDYFKFVVNFETIGVQFNHVHQLQILYFALTQKQLTK